MKSDARARCFYCGAELYPIEECQRITALHPWRFPHRFTIDHRRPRYWGGGDEPENRVECCHSCNMAKGACDVEEFRRLLGEKYDRPSIVFYGEGGRLEDTLAFSAASVARWQAGDLNACVWLCPPPKGKGSPELMTGQWIDPDPVVIFPAQEYKIGKGTNLNGGAVYTIVDEAGYIVAQSINNTRPQRGSISRLILQANYATTITLDTPKKARKGKA